MNVANPVHEMVLNPLLTDRQSYSLHIENENTKNISIQFHELIDEKFML